MKKSPLKVGFDLDGVLLQNPARMFRPITLAFKQIIGRKTNQAIHFYYPETSIEKLIWRVVHWSSYKVSDGYEDLKQLSSLDTELYIITSRYDCLRDDFHAWLKKMNTNKYFKGTFYNKNNLQPHIFKAEQINKLKLDYFVEDNYDIVRHINQTTPAKALWITNLLDSKIEYDFKYGSLKEAVDFVKNEVRKYS